MKIHMFTNKLRLLAILLIGLISTAQAQWSGAYGNEWLAGKYGQEWVRIGVTQKGVHKVALPSNFQNKQGDLHLYHRGEEVSLLTATATEIEFYGVPNDGVSDALLYRPYTGVRANPYYSWFSDESAYFLTHSSGSATKVAITQPVIAPTGVPEAYHMQSDLTVYSNDYTHDEGTNTILFSLDQSYFEEGKAMTGSGVFKYIRADGNVVGNPVFTFPFQLEKVVMDVAQKPKFEILYHSRTNTTHEVKSKVGKTSSDTREFPNNLVFNTFAPYKVDFELNASSIPASSDVDINGNGVFTWEDLKPSSNLQSVGIFSIAYIKRTYPQIISMSGLSTKHFNFPATLNLVSRVQILNAPAGSRVYDISNGHEPKLIPYSLSGNTLDLMVQRVPNQDLTLLVMTNGSNNSKVSAVSFTPYNPSDKEYLIISNNTLSASAQEYADYRSSVAGGSYRTLAVRITDIYNQFNYGEPSPVAIKHFVDYMISQGVREKHNLLLIGHSTTIPKIMKNNRELPDEVPTIGFPGSDILLVEGLAPGHDETSTIPVGRISATLPSQVINYLNKVQQYESTSTDLNWRKKVLHIGGGIYTGENTRFSGYLSNYDHYITGSTFSGSVQERKKADGDYGYPSNAFDFAPDFNGGLGFTAYYGHGSTTQTDNNLGYASDPSRGYSNSGKYPVMYFNGCGVGNIFSGRTSLFPGSSSSTLLPLSSDWVLADNKGAIAVIANSYYAFETSSKIFIGALHQQLFKEDASRKTLGQINQDAQKMVMDGYSGARIAVNNYDIANNHQSLLQGDPALRVLMTANPLPVGLLAWKGEAVGGTVKLSWKTEWEKNNSHFIIERSADALHFEEVGLIDGKGDTDAISNYTYIDYSPAVGKNYYRLAQVDFAKSGSIPEDKAYTRIIQVEVDMNGGLVVIPNPTSDFAKVQIDSREQIISLHVYDLKGQLLRSNVGEERISLEKLLPGQYIIEVNTNTGSKYSKKILKN